MRIEKEPIFRKIIIPWYDSKPACLISILFLFLVFIFGITGIITAYENVNHTAYVWVPILITLMSGIVIVSIMIRLLKRYV